MRMFYNYIFDVLYSFDTLKNIYIYIYIYIEREKECVCMIEFN